MRATRAAAALGVTLAGLVAAAGSASAVGSGTVNGGSGTPNPVVISVFTGTTSVTSQVQFSGITGAATPVFINICSKSFTDGTFDPTNDCDLSSEINPASTKTAASSFKMFVGADKNLGTVNCPISTVANPVVCYVRFAPSTDTTATQGTGNLAQFEVPFIYVDGGPAPTTTTAAPTTTAAATTTTAAGTTTTAAGTTTTAAGVTTTIKSTTTTISPVVPESPINVLLPVGGIAVLGGGAFYLTRKRRPHAA